MSRGVICMAFGEKAAAEAEVLAARLAEYNLPVAIVGDCEIPGAEFIEWQGEDPFDRGAPGSLHFLAGRVKPSLYALSPFSETLYLDTDCKPASDPTPGFDLLADYDMAVAEHPGQLCSQLYNRPRVGWYHSRREAAYTCDLWGCAEVPFWNSGVIFFRRGKPAGDVFRAWSEEWRRFGQWDEQLALMRAVRAHPLRLCVLPVGWNAPHAYQAEVIHHWYGRGTSRATKGAADA